MVPDIDEPIINELAHSISEHHSTSNFSANGEELSGMSSLSLNDDEGRVKSPPSAWLGQASKVSRSKNRTRSATGSASGSITGSAPSAGSRSGSGSSGSSVSSKKRVPTTTDNTSETSGNLEVDASGGEGGDGFNDEINLLKSLFPSMYVELLLTLLRSGEGLERSTAD
jgi:hypothetical protein